MTKDIEIRNLMTPDEKLIWAAVFASVNTVMAQQKLRARSDIVRDAAAEADYTVATVRRMHAQGQFERDPGSPPFTRGLEISKPEDVYTREIEEY